MLCMCGALCGQTFDLTTGRVPIASLDGLWRFHTGDNPAWADPNFDDSKWPLLRSDEGWDSQGYKEYSGLAWYRFQVSVPTGIDHVSLYLPQIRACYEVYADGKLIGTFGKMPPNASAYYSWLHYQLYSLPARKPGEQKIEVALRVWQWPGWVKYHEGGPQNGGGLVGDTQEIEHRNDLDRADMFEYVANSQILVLLETLAGFGTLALFVLRRKETEYLCFSLIMFFYAAFNWSLVFESTHVWRFSIGFFLRDLFLNGAAFASIAFYRRMLQPSRSWLLKLATAAVALRLLISMAQFLSGYALGVWLSELIGLLWDLVFWGCIISVVLTRARQHSPDARLLLTPVVLRALTDLLEDVTGTTQTLGWQKTFTDSIPLIHKPFPIDISEAAEVLFLVAVFGILILRFARTRSHEERFASEVQSARNVQRYLIPEHLPPTPGFTIQSEYRPAREVGGDFFQVLPNLTDGSVLIVVGDVAGKGMQAGMLATLIVGAIRTADAFTSDPAKILTLLNERLQGRGLVTCLGIRIEHDGSATLVNAGHLPPYLNARELPMEGALPLGAIPGTEFPVMRFHLAEGDSLTLMSDGIAEAQDASGSLFGFERIGAMLRESATVAALASAAQDFGQEDDITVLRVARLAQAIVG